MGHGAGGKMVSSAYSDNPSSEYYYIYYYDENTYQKVTAISKIDEKNLKQIASDLGVDYIQTFKKANIDYKIADIKQEMSNSQTKEEKITTYKDIYYYFAIPLAILLIIDFVLKKRRIE